MKQTIILLLTLVFITASQRAWSQAATDVACTAPCISTTEIVNSAVTGAKIQNSAVTTAKISDGTITNSDISSTANISASKINDGSGTGLDADLLDGVNSTAFLRNDQTGAIIGDLNVSGSLTSSSNITSAGSVIGNQLCIGSDCHSSWPDEADLLDGLDASQFLRSDQTGTLNGDLTVSGTMRLYGDSGAYGIYFEPAGAENVGIHKLSNEGAPWGGSWTSFDDFTPTTADLLLLGHEGISFGTRQGEDILGMRVTSSGNVGIGTTAPNNKLQVIGGAYFNAGGTFAPGGVLVDWDGLHLEHDDAINISAPVGLNLAISRAAPAVAIRNNSGPAMLVEVGNVGIGTTSPAYPLDVTGAVKGDEICIGSDCRSTWPSLEIGIGSITSDHIQDSSIVNSDISSTASIDPTKISGTAWTFSNDGSGTELDADKIDGLDSTIFLRSDQTGAIAGDLSVSGSLTSSSNMTSAGSVTGNQLCIGSDCRSSWPDEADLLDGLDASQFLRSDQTGTLNGDLTVSGTMRLYGDSGAYGIYFEPAGAENVGIHKLSNEGAPWGGSWTSFDDFTPTTADLLLLGHEGISFGTRQGEDILGMRVTSSGNVGIGTTSPTEKLEVAGNIKLSGNIVSDGDICIGQCE